MMYKAEYLTRKSGDLDPLDYQACLNTYTELGYRFVQAIPQGIGRAVVIFEKATPNCEGIKWLTELNSSIKDCTITE